MSEGVGEGGMREGIVGGRGGRGTVGEAGRQRARPAL